MTTISLSGDVLIQVYNDNGLTVRSFEAGTFDVNDDDLALLRHYAVSSFTVVAAADAPAEAPAEAAPAPVVDEPKDA